MESKAKISVVIPVYQVERFLPQCLDSVCKQSLKELEIICVEDGSTDGSFDILKEYQQKDPRIQIYVNQEEGAGAAQARNLGLSKATGDYVLVLDSDDYFHPELAEKTYQLAVETEADLVLFDAIWFDSNTGKDLGDGTTLRRDHLPKKEVFSGKDVAAHIFQLSHGAAWSKLYKGSFLKKYNLSFQAVHVIDDVFFTSTALSVAEKIAVVDEKLLYYRVNNSSSQMNNKERDPLSPQKVSEKLKGWLEKEEVFEIYKESYFRCIVMLFQLYLSSFEKEEHFSLLYQYLQKEGLEKSGLLNSCEKEGFSKQTKHWIQSILQKDAHESFLALREGSKGHIKEGMTVAVYGFGSHIEDVFDKICSCGAVCVSIVDSFEGKQGQVFRGITVEKPEFLLSCAPALILISSPFYFDEIKANLIALGVSEDIIVLA